MPEFPEELRDLELPQEQLMAAMFNLLIRKQSRELQTIPEDRPSRPARREATEKAPREPRPDFPAPEECTTLFMNAGSRLHIRPKDVAGLLYNEGGAPRGSVGDIRIFPKHTLIEVSTEVTCGRTKAAATTARTATAPASARTAASREAATVPPAAPTGAASGSPCPSTSASPPPATANAEHRAVCHDCI